MYGSPKSEPENPSPESAKIAESVVLLEFIADLYPDSGLLPKDPVDPARVRFFIDAFTAKDFAHAGALFVYGEGSPDAFVAAVAEIQELLQPAAQFGDHFPIADAATMIYTVPIGRSLRISQKQVIPRTWIAAPPRNCYSKQDSKASPCTCVFWTI